MQSAIYYFDAGRDYSVPHASTPTTTFIESVTKWNVDVRHVENELRRQAVSSYLMR